MCLSIPVCLRTVEYKRLVSIASNNINCTKDWPGEDDRLKQRINKIIS